MKMSDIFDIPLILMAKDGYMYKLEFEDYALEQPSDFPYIAFLKQGEILHKNDLEDYIREND